MRAKLGPQFLGDIDPAQIFPILTKIITAHDWLSVQVHPDDAYAQRVEHQPFGKTECWFVFSAQPGAELVLGWTRDTSREEYERRVADGTLGEILRKIPVKAGDTVYIPCRHRPRDRRRASRSSRRSRPATSRTGCSTGTASGLDGKPRELHIQKAADVLHYTGAARRRSSKSTTGSKSRPHGADRRPALHRRAHRRRRANPPRWRLTNAR